MRNNCLIIFVKYPEPGQVKSRLAKDFDDLFAADLYKAFVLDILERTQKGNWQLRVFFDPPEKEDEIKIMFGPDYLCRPQRGADLGVRMKNAFHDCFSEGCRSAVLIGSDFPDLPLKIIEDAFALLDSPGGVVMGPAVDGGYYLIGLTPDALLPDIFSGIPWSTAAVFSETLKILDAHRLSVKMLPRWQDVDTRNDLIGLMERNRLTPFARSRTMNYLTASGKFTAR